MPPSWQEARLLLLYLLLLFTKLLMLLYSQLLRMDNVFMPILVALGRVDIYTDSQMGSDRAHLMAARHLGSHLIVARRLGELVDHPAHAANSTHER